MHQKNREIISKDKSISDWYTSIVEKAGLIHYSNIKGFMSFLPYGWAIWEKIQSHLNFAFKKEKIKNVALPSLFPYSDLVLESSHVKGFKPELFLIEHKGKEILNDPYVLRPTSEAAFCKLWNQTLRTYQQLPLLYNQWCSVFRVEKNTRPFLRNSEFYWQEMHGAFSNDQDCQKMVDKIIEIYSWLINKILMIPTISGKKTVNEKFAGAEETYTLETIMPDGQALQSATSHNLGQNFAKAFDIKFQGKNNAFEMAHTMSAGLSTRIIGGLIMTHGDDNGLVLPFNIAPIQIMLIPMFAQKNKDVLKITKQIAAELKEYEVEIDENDNNSLGSKIADNEIRGIPFQIIIGPKDLENNKATIIVRNDTKNKHQVEFSKIASWIADKSKEYDEALYLKAKERYQNQIVIIDNQKDFINALNNQKVILAPWAGNENDEASLKKTTGATARCISIEKQITNEKCFFTNKKAKHWVYFARAY